jgi:hypothetical protein
MLPEPRSQVSDAKPDPKSQNLVDTLVESVQKGIDAEVAKGDKANDKMISAYGAVITSAAALQKSLPVKQTLSFRISRQEVGILLAYAVGGIVLLFAIPFFTPWATWKSSDLAGLFLDWSGVFAILLGASALPQLTGKGGSSSGGSTAAAGAAQGGGKAGYFSGQYAA